MTVIGSREVLPAGSMRINPGPVYLKVHAPISPAGCSATDLEKLCSEVRQTIASALPAGL